MKAHRPIPSRLIRSTLACAVAAVTGWAHATLPPPSPAQAQAAAEKKAAADAQAQKDKQELLATMDAITTRWRSRAASQGWKANPPVAVAAPAPAAAGAAASTPTVAQPGTKAAPPMPIRSEKAGTAPPSADVKKKP